MRKTALLAICVLASVICISGQEAKLMILDISDTVELKAAYKEYKDAQAKWETTKTKVAKKYTFENGKVMPGWEQVQFSVDFRAVVPDSSQYVYHSGYIYSPCNTGITNLNSSISNSATWTGTSSDLSINLGDSHK
jgi:hypothetical protein